MIALAASAGAALAANSPWQDLGGGKARLLAELDPTTNAVSGVVEIALDPGWKTYWRQPGSSGIPPQFDFSGSREFSAGDVTFPVPEHVVVPDSDFVGYHGRVLFTFSGTANTLDPDGRIRLGLLAGVCKDICIPASAEFEIPFNQLMVSDPVAEGVVADAAQDLPGKPTDDFAVMSARIANGALEIATRVPAENGKADLFVEGPPGWRLLPAVAESDSGTKRRFSLDLSRVPAGTDVDSVSLRFTLVQDGRGIEQWLKPSE
jgi:DsbC/DsbD-like thiol-disulfide interchange protein